jgi:hypothetical protein
VSADTRRSLSLLLWCLGPFVILATANSAGYRYGASDLAFYGPAVMRRLDPRLFPRDAPLIDAQARLTLMDETVATLARLTTDHLPTLFLGLYLLTLGLLAVALVLIGRQLYASRWTIAALLAAATLRHAIAKSGTNTLEAYFHPRQLAFAFGALAVAAFLRGKVTWTALALAGAALLHPTTTLWFVLWLAVAFIVSSRRPQTNDPEADPKSAGTVLDGTTAMVAAAICAAAAAAWAFTAGPLSGRLAIMDREWLDAIAEKDYLFPLQWPATAWLINLAYAPLIWAIHRRRASAGLVAPRETGLVAGCLALVAIFLAAVALNSLHIALAVQLQPARAFWILDFLAVVYIVWALAEGSAGSGRPPRLAAAAVVLVAALRGVYIMEVEFPDRPLFEPSVPGDWGRVTAWARQQPPASGWLADPAHASKYGTSFRMAAGHDVFIEATKDLAVGMYDRRIALRARDRRNAVGDFSALSAGRARQLASDHGLDYLVTEQEMPLPERFRAGAIRVYQLR